MMAKEVYEQENLFFIGLGVGVGAVIALGASALWTTTGGLLDASQVTTPLLGYAAREAQVMGLPVAEGTKVYWYLARAGGLIAYLLLWAATLWGVMMSGKTLKGRIDAALLYAMHEFLPILAMVFAVFHAVILLGDSYIRFDLFDLLVPFQAPYRPVWTGLGTLSLYLSLALIASFYIRSIISRRVWRLFHYTTYLAFILAMMHGVMAGTDASQPVVQWMYVLTGQTLLLVTLHRVLMARSGAEKAERAPKSSTPAAAAKQAAMARRRPADRDRETQRAVTVDVAVDSASVHEQSAL
jgi:DMSO/TMAO reductase YedYZ heme-binding membrane subunit